MKCLHLLFLFSSIPTILGYGTGAPLVVCSDMTPKHHTDPQKSPPMHKVLVQPRKINAGENVTVTLSAPSGRFFKGFLVQVRPVGKNEAIGSFVYDETMRDVMQPLNCFEKPNSALTHVSNNDKSQLTATWISPKDYQGEVAVRATFVEQASTFWVNVTGENIEVSSANGLASCLSFVIFTQLMSYLFHKY